MDTDLLLVDVETREVVPSGDSWTLGEIYYLLDCEMVEPLRCKDGLLLVDEEGIFRRKPLNPVATALAGQPIVGSALLVRDERRFR